MADADAVQHLADGMRTVERQLAGLREPADAAAAQPAVLSAADRRKAVRRLEAERDRAETEVARLAQQCDQARASVERLAATLQQKMEVVEQLQQPRSAGLATAEPSAVPSAADEARAALRAQATAHIESLNQQIELAKSSRRQAARHADEVADRETLRGLGVGTMLATASRITPELQDAVAQWLRSALPAQRGSGRRAASTTTPFRQALDAAFERLDRCAANPEESARDALRAVLSVVSRCEAHSVHSVIEQHVVQVLARSLLVAGMGVSHGMSLSELTEPYRRLGITPAQTAVRQIGAALERSLNQLRSAQQARARSVQFAGQMLTAQQISRTITQCEAMKARFEASAPALQSVLEALGQGFIGRLAVDDVEALGAKVAPRLDAYYKNRIGELRTEVDVQQRLMHMPAAAASRSTPAGGSGADQVENRISRLRGEMLRFEEQHQKQFQQYAGLAARHIDATETLEAVERELAQHQEGLQAAHQERREAMQQRVAAQTEAGRLEEALDRMWSEAVSSPQLSSLIAPEALERAARVHVGQTAEQMRARMDEVVRTGTFQSRAGLLQVVADVARHELGKREPVLLAPTQAELVRVADGYPAGRVDALCNHGRRIGHGVRRASGGLEESRTGTSQYSLGWSDEAGVRITHLHPWISPY